jgi:hypothetical protein
VSTPVLYYLVAIHNPIFSVEKKVTQLVENWLETAKNGFFG